MNRPVCKVISLPLGAVRSTLSSAILEAADIRMYRLEEGLVIEAAMKAIERRVRKGVRRVEDSATIMSMR